LIPATLHTVALLVPAYRAATYLPRFAKAASGQLHPFTEWLCHDDASDDETASVARSLGFKVSVSPANEGPSRARNRLAENTRCEWLHYHDADDLLAPEYLQRVLTLVSPDCDVILCDSSWELESTRQRVILWSYRQAAYDRDPLGYITSHPVGVISALIRRSAFLKIGGFDETARCWEDADLFVRLAEAGARFKMTEAPLVTSLRHDRGISRDQHHCDHCRLKFLHGYAGRHPATNHRVIASESEKLILNFIRHHDRASALSALELCRRLGSAPPTTENLLLRALKSFVPALTLIGWQDTHRRKFSHFFR
jgi:glycosyltransferase involved in cell wall biosynthesis